MGGGRVRSPSGPSALVVLNLLPRRKRPVASEMRSTSPTDSPPPVAGKHLTWLAPSVEGKELCIGAASVVQWRPAEPPAEAKAEIAGVRCKARWEARFLWFCGESIGEARVRSLRLSR